MGTCTSAANYESTDNGKPIRDTEDALLQQSYNLGIDQWSCDNVYEWLSAVDDGDLKELANKFKNERIKGKVLDSVCDEQLKEMGAKIGDILAFKKAREVLFKDYGYPSSFIQQQETQTRVSIHPRPPLRGRTSNDSYHSIGGGSGHSNRGMVGDISYNNHHQTHPMGPPGYNPRPQQSSQSVPYSQHQQFPSMPGCFPQTSIVNNNSSQDKSQDLLPITDPTYAAIDFRDLNVNGGEGDTTNVNMQCMKPMAINNNNVSNKSNSGSHTKSISPIIVDNKDSNDGDMGKCARNKQAKLKYGLRGIKKNRNNNQSKPGLDRSLSVGDMGSNINLQIHKHSHSHSHPHSNPVYNNTHNHKYNIVHYNKPIVQMANILKCSMKNEAKTAIEIVEMMKSQHSNIQNKDQICDVIYNELLDLKVLIKDSTITDTEKYKIDHTVYNKVMDKFKSTPPSIPQPRSHPLLQSNTKSNIAPLAIPPDVAHVPWGGGTPVTVFSPKSQVWREGIVLNFDPKTNIGRVCCYNKMGKQSIKDLSLPNKLVRPIFELPATNIPPPNMSSNIPVEAMTVATWNNTYVNQDS